MPRAIDITRGAASGIEQFGFGVAAYYGILIVSTYSGFKGGWEAGKRVMTQTDEPVMTDTNDVTKIRPLSLIHI